VRARQCVFYFSPLVVALYFFVFLISLKQLRVTNETRVALRVLHPVHRSRRGARRPPVAVLLLHGVQPRHPVADRRAGAHASDVGGAVHCVRCNHNILPLLHAADVPGVQAGRAAALPVL